MQVLAAVLIGVIGVVLLKAGMSSSGSTLFDTLFSTKASPGASGLVPKSAATPKGAGGGGVSRMAPG